jgi:hypothetical protein
MTPQGRAYLTSGRVALLLFAFTYQSRFAVEAWAKPFRGEFEKNEQVTFYEFPMIAEWPAWGNGLSIAACGEGHLKAITRM